MTDERRRLCRDLLGVFLLALAARLALAMALPDDDSVFWDQPYWRYAQNFAEGRGFWMPNPYGKGIDLPKVYAFRPPLFPFLWGCVWKLTHGAYAPIRIAFAVLGAATCALAYLVGRQLTGRRGVAWLAGALCALYPPLIWHSVHLMTEPMFIFLGVLCLYALFCAEHTGRWRWVILAGAAAGLAALTRSVFAGFVPVIALWIGWACRRHGRAWPKAAAFAGVVLLVMLPWVVRNAVVLRAFVPTTTDAGHGFYVANNPRSLSDPRGFWIPEDWSFLAGKGSDTSVDEVTASRRLAALARHYLLTHPAEAADLMARRFITLWRFYPHPEFVDKRYVLLYAVSYIPLFLFMLPGAWWIHRQGREWLPALLLVDALVLYTTGVHTVVLAMIRYREPLMPFLLVFSAVGILGVASRVLGREKKDAADIPSTASQNS